MLLHKKPEASRNVPHMTTDVTFEPIHNLNSPAHDGVNINNSEDEHTLFMDDPWQRPWKSEFIVGHTFSDTEQF